MNRLVLIAILFLFPFLGASAQATEEGPILPEYLYAHLDRDLYVTGEQLWYRVYFLQPQDYIRSKVVHVEVLNPRGEVVAHNQPPRSRQCSYWRHLPGILLESGHVYPSRIYLVESKISSQNFLSLGIFPSTIPKSLKRKKIRILPQNRP